MPVREFVDSAGVTWEVFEVHRQSERPISVSEALKHGWLTFVTASEKRRLTDYPAAWASLADSELERMCDRARAAPTARFPLRNSIEPRLTPDVDVPLGRSTITAARIRAFALDARVSKKPAIQAAVELKQMFAAEGIDGNSSEFKDARRLFVEAYYFG